MEWLQRFRLSVHTGSHVSIVGYGAVQPVVHGMGSVLTMDHGMTRVSLGDLGHMAGFHH